MTELPVFWRDRTVFTEAFGDGLERMLTDHDGLGVFILVLANTTHEPALRERLWRALVARFVRHRHALRETLARGARPVDAEDDVAVFLRLALLGLEALPSTEWRATGPWQLQYNLLRALRPPRMADAVIDSLQRPFDPAGFHFDRPFLRKEILWEGELEGQSCRLLYNKFPFAPLHGLLLIEPKACRPQVLDRVAHGLVWRLCERAGEQLPGLGFGFNAYGAFASVNHQHFQSFVLEEGGIYPVEDARWSHNGGTEDYPVPCLRLDDEAAAWEAVETCYRDNHAFNLLYRPGRLYLLRRRFQGQHPLPEWSGGFAWSELAGSFTLFERAAFEGLEASDIMAALTALAP
ncbi:GDP-D-glucose phosphorylase 1 family protein [endosymbiont of unidentified scaly snail isolate Monju]|uniref:hypothetical protein n=1 Tax=endosymbiont of unidentified scaly snail isolate Monju TaxID=1248727 RepID=UPI0003891DEE|nr:hypothetical protein [endosymbiont of unidentified scaly snail isolate Monju]BAN69778.1 conserved hypothetical protein [endosymbiont of unidentified scaly snail isolate Monju]